MVVVGVLRALGAAAVLGMVVGGWRAPVLLEVVAGVVVVLVAGVGGRLMGRGGAIGLIVGAEGGLRPAC